jgi:hypothetical protein
MRLVGYSARGQGIQVSLGDQGGDDGMAGALRDVRGFCQVGERERPLVRLEGFEDRDQAFDRGDVDAAHDDESW